MGEPLKGKVSADEPPKPQKMTPAPPAEPMPTPVTTPTTPPATPVQSGQVQQDAQQQAPNKDGDPNDTTQSCPPKKPLGGNVQTNLMEIPWEPYRQLLGGYWQSVMRLCRTHDHEKCEPSRCPVRYWLQGLRAG